MLLHGIEGDEKSIYSEGGTFFGGVVQASHPVLQKQLLPVSPHDYSQLKPIYSRILWHSEVIMGLKEGLQTIYSFTDIIENATGLKRR